MKEYVYIMAATLLLAWLISRTVVGHAGLPETRMKDRICYFLIFCVLSLFLGLRIKYNDTFVYVKSYESFPTFPDFWKTFDSKLGANPGFSIVTAWLKTKDVSSFGFTLLYEAIYIAAVLYFLKKHNYDLMLSLFLFFATNSYSASAAAIKQAISVAFAILAVDAAIERKWIKYAVLLLIASTFHPYVLLYGFLPILFFKPWTKMTYILLGVTIVVGFTLESMLGTIVDIASLIGDNYEAEGFIGDGISIFRVLVANMPLVLSFVFKKSMFRNNDREQNVMINLAMINGAIMFVGLFGNPIYFSRLATYFTFFQCMAIPVLLRGLAPGNRKFFTVATVVGYGLFFVYANVIAQSFDAEFSRITLLQYLKEYVFK